MLRCSWCGERPLQEFELLAGGGPGDNGPFVMERWWHRLGCGRPLLVEREPSTGEARPASGRRLVLVSSEPGHDAEPARDVELAHDIEPAHDPSPSAVDEPSPLSAE